MNTLSWLIYAGDVADAAGGALIALMIIFAICTIIFAIVVVFEMDVLERNFEDVQSAAYAKKAFVGFVTCLVISVLIPSGNTIYMIAGSEAGEVVVESDYGREILDKVKAVIDAKLTEAADG